VGFTTWMLYLFSGLVLVDNAGDLPDADPSTVYMIVTGIFVLFLVSGVFIRGYRIDRNGEAVR